MFRRSRAKTLMLAIGSLVFLAFTGGVTFLVYTRYFVDGGQSTESRSRASSASGSVKLTLETDATTRYVKDTFPVRVYLDTAGKTISGVAFGLSYDSGSAANPDFEVLDSNPAVAGVQIESDLQSLNPCFGDTPQVNLVSRPTMAGNRKVYIDFSAACANAAGYTTPATGKVLLATIWMRANVVGAGTFTLEHDPTKAIATELSTGTDVLQTVAPITFSIAADTQKPVVSITEGLAEGASTASGRIKFTFTAQDMPERPADLARPEGYLQYSFYVSPNHTHTAAQVANAMGAPNAAGTAITANTWSNSPELEMVLTHGPKTLFVRTRDQAGNISDTVSRKFTLDLTPFIETVTPGAGPENTVVTLRGYNFGPTRNVVRMGTVAVPAANFTSWTNEEIVFRVPITANGDITVQAAGTPTFSAPKPYKLETRLSIVYLYEKIASDRGPRKVDVSVFKGTTSVAELKDQNATWSATDNAYKVITDPLPDGALGAGHTISLKDGSHLRRKFINQSIVRGRLNAYTRKAAADTLKVGDFNSDNRIDIVDFGQMMTQIKGLTTPVSELNARFDVDGDGQINFLDVAALLMNYTALQVPGDTQN